MSQSHDPEGERLFFEHDLATPFTNLRGAHFLLKLSLPSPSADIQESLDILDGNTHILEKMLGWYWRTRELGHTLEAVEPWPAARLCEGLSDRLAEADPKLAPPSGDPGRGLLTVPQEPLEVGLIGALVTLRNASETQVDWTLEGTEGLCIARYGLSGGDELLDVERIFRKYYWPGHRRLSSWLDAGLPYLTAVLRPYGGGLELSYKEGRWCLECSIPTLPKA